MPNASDHIARILFASGSEHGVLPPTALFNEGWLLRLTLDWFSHQPYQDHPLAFSAGAQWASERLLRSQFRPRWRGDPLAEAFTHADGVIGHFRVRPERGDLDLAPAATQFVVAEAKLYSGLSAGTTRAKSFNQAARNVACIAELVGDREPQSFQRLGFYVVAPADQIAGGVFGRFCEREDIGACVQARVASYGGEKDKWYRERFLPMLSAIDVQPLSWEGVIAHISSADPEAGTMLSDFYSRCRQFNRTATRA